MHDAPVIRDGEPVFGFLNNLYFGGIDRMLRAEGIPFLRYIDSYWVFTKTEEDARSNPNASLLYLSIIESDTEYTENGNIQQKQAL